jgi:Xaa-Pro aminopeptidase
MTIRQVNSTSSATRGWGRVPFDYEARLAFADLAFPDNEYRDRTASLQRRLTERGLAGAVIVGNIDAANVAYLSGYSSPLLGDVVLVVARTGEPVLITDAIVHGEPMHTEIFQTWLRDVRCSPPERARAQYGTAASLRGHLEDVFKQLSLRTSAVGYSGPRDGRVAYAVRELAGSVELIDDELKAMRAVKSSSEVRLLRSAAAIADAALLSGLASVTEGATEHDVAGAIGATMLRKGADGPLYMIQVAAGPRSGLRNVHATSRPLQNGELAYIGFGLRYRGYCARTSRSHPVGRASDDQLRFLEANARIVEAALNGVGPGTAVSELANTAHEVAGRLGVLDDLWAGGHGVGLHTHDRPTISPSSDERFEVGNVFVFEPMLIRTNFGTANAESLYVITEIGVDALSRLPLRTWESTLSDLEHETRTS